MRLTKPRRPALSEAAFRKQVTDLATLCGWLVYYVPDSRRVTSAGYPDLTLVKYKGGNKRVIFAELKTDAGRVRPEQAVWVSALNAAGQTAVIWRPKLWDAIKRELEG
jgi:hypothetical protein